MDDGNRCYIINNQILGYYIGGWAGHYPFNAYYQLSRLFDNLITRKSFPKQLHKFFTSTSDLPSAFQHSPLIGDINDYFHHVVRLETKIDEQLFAPVILYNIYYKNHQLRQEYDPINLTSQEAFLIFSNILANDRCYFYDQRIPIEDIDVKSTYHSHHYASYGESYDRLARYSHNYMLYLKDALLSKTLTPYEIAFHSGNRILCNLSYLQPIESFTRQILTELEKPENLSMNRKIIYYCFLNELSCQYNPSLELELNHQYFTGKLEQLIDKKF